MRSFRWIVVAHWLLAGVLWGGIADAKPKSSAPVKTETYVRVSDEKMMRISAHTDGSKDTTYFESGTKATPPPKSGPMVKSKSNTSTPPSASRRSETPRFFDELPSRSGHLSSEEKRKVEAIARVSALIQGTQKAGPPLLGMIERHGEYSEYITALCNDEEMIRMVGALALVESGSSSVPYLLQVLSRYDEDDRIWASACLCVIGEPALSAISKAREHAMGSEREWLDYALACALANMVTY